MMELEFEISCFDASGKVVETATASPAWRRNGNRFENAELGISFAVETEETSSGVRVRIPANEMKESEAFRFRTLTVLLPDAAGHEDDGGALVLPFDSGMLCHTCGKLEKEYRIPVFSERDWDIFWCNMAFYARCSGGTGYAVALEDGKFDCELRLRTNFGEKREYRVDPVFLLREWTYENRLESDISLVCGKFPCSGVNEIAKWYREYNLNIRKLPTLAEKARNNPGLAYSARAITVRCRMAVKKLPCTVYEQTPETEPPIRVYMRYPDVSNIARKYAELGVGPSEFNLVGWNYGGHDGAFPQIFPVCAAVGTEDELRASADAVQDAGYHFNLHDNYYDGYTLADNFDFNDVCTDDDPYHMPVHAGGILGGGRAYRICGAKGEKYAARNIAEIKKRFPRLSGAFFSDVISLIAVRKCANPQHPQSRADNAASWKRIMQMKHDNFGVSMSEGGRDWALPELDRAYMLQNKPGNEKAYDYTDEAVPLYELVYHGFLIYNIFRSGINTWPGSFEYLWNLALGGLPMVYYHHLFNPDWGAHNGCKNDLAATPEAIEADTPLIKRVSDDVAKLAKLQMCTMEKFVRHGEELVEVEYSGGTRVLANFGNAAATIDGVSVPPMDFSVIEGK